MILKIESLNELLFQTSNDFMWKVEMPESENRMGDIEAWGKAVDTIRKAVPPVLETLEDEFRILLGHSQDDAGK